MEERQMIALLLLALQGDIDPRLLALYEQSNAVSPALASQALTRLASDARWPRDLRASALQSAFERASAVMEAAPVAQAMLWRNSGAAYWRAEASRLGLDRLTLQTQAVLAMVKVEPALARKMWEQMTPPAVGTLSCQDELIPEVDRYYQAAVSIADRAFTPEERKKGAHLAMLAGLAGRMRSPVEVAPIVMMTRGAVLAAEDKEALATRTLAALEALRGDDRSFTASAFKASGAIDSWNHPRAAAVFRDYVVRHLKQARCSDNLEGSRLLQQHLRKYGGIEPDIKPERVIEGPPVSFPKPYAPMLGLSGRRLELVAAADRGSPAWRSRLSGFLDEVAGADPARVDPARSLKEKIQITVNTLALLEDGGDRAAVLARLAGMIAADPLQDQQQAVWLSLADYARRTCYAVMPAAAAVLLDAMERTENPALVFWARMERLLPGTLP